MLQTLEKSIALLGRRLLSSCQRVPYAQIGRYFTAGIKNGRGLVTLESFPDQCNWVFAFIKVRLRTWVNICTRCSVAGSTGESQSQPCAVVDVS